LIELKEGGFQPNLADKFNSLTLSHAEFSMGSFHVTQSNPAHRLADPTQPTQLKFKNLDTTQPNATSAGFRGGAMGATASGIHIQRGTHTSSRTF